MILFQNEANENQEPENSEISYVNLDEQRESGVISDSKVNIKYKDKNKIYMYIHSM